MLLKADVGLTLVSCAPYDGAPCEASSGKELNLG